jgi:hypothetical protein
VDVGIDPSEVRPIPDRRRARFNAALRAALQDREFVKSVVRRAVLAALRDLKRYTRA